MAAEPHILEWIFFMEGRLQTYSDSPLENSNKTFLNSDLGLW